MIGVVAIARNEGPRLRACIESALQAAPGHVVYVDSGSTDGSVAIAQSMGADVVELDLSTPFTAARARNAGFERLMQVDPSIEFVQFVDGDCELVNGWTARAEAEFTGAPRLAVVCGRRRERFPDASIYNALCDVEWDTPVGPARSCGGDAMIRVAAFREVGGYNPAVIAGEEPELCVRLRAGGWLVRRIDAEMTLHDAAMTRFGQWWRRNVRAGHAYAEGHAMHGAPPVRHWAREVRSNWFWGALLPAAVAAMLIAGLFWWPLLIGAAVLAMLFPAQIARLSHRAHRRYSARLARAYAAAIVVGKFPQALGQLKYLLSRHTGHRTAIIEYKPGVALAPQGHPSESSTPSRTTPRAPTAAG